MGNEWGLESLRPGIIPNWAIYSVTLLSDPYFPFWSAGVRNQMRYCQPGMLQALKEHGVSQLETIRAP